MSEPKRYIVVTVTGPDTGTRWGEMREHPDGDFVGYPDYAALRAKYERLRETLERSRGRVKQLRSKNNRLVKQVLNLAARAALADTADPTEGRES